jgi:hypothetical protein
MIKWHRTTIRNEYGVPIMTYYTDEKDWARWTIDRLPRTNGSRTTWYVYQVKYHGADSGLPQATLRNAKKHVERTGRNDT